MSAEEPVKELKTLSANEPVEGFNALRTALEKEKRALNARLAEINQALNSGGSEPVKANGVGEDFKKIADHVFTKNAELFRKLSQ